MISNSPILIGSKLSATATNALRDIKPPVEIPSGWAWVLWTLATLAAGVVLFWVWRYWQNRRAQAAVIPPIPAHVRAQQRLREALPLITHPPPLCIMLSHTLRCYLS